jgi:hypothetical protein
MPRMDKEERKKYNRKYLENNRDRHREINRQWEIKKKIEILTYYGDGIPACVLCGHNKINSLSIDHINGGGLKHRKSIGNRNGGNTFYRWLSKNNFPDGYRTLCMNCQFEEAAHMRAGAVLQKLS